VTPHKFKPGQTVLIAERRYEHTPSGTFTVVRAMPTEHGVRNYRVRSNVDGHERIVTEAELN
jgi:hypothetical protein